MTCDPHRFEVFTELHQCINCGMRLEDHQHMENYQKEIRTVITTWSRELDIEKTWDDELHIADVLDKYVFPKIRDQITGLKMQLVAARKDRDTFKRMFDEGERREAHKEERIVELEAIKKALIAELPIVKESDKIKEEK